MLQRVGNVEPAVAPEREAVSTGGARGRFPSPMDSSQGFAVAGRRLVPVVDLNLPQFLDFLLFSHWILEDSNKIGTFSHYSTFVWEFSHQDMVIFLQESKRERFTRVAERRTNAVLEKMRVLGNCANRAMYDYTEEDVSKVFGAIKKALRETESLYRQKSNKRFRLKE